MSISRMIQISVNFKKDEDSKVNDFFVIIHNNTD